MKRHIIRISLIMLLGVVTSVAVAWVWSGLSRRGPDGSERHMPSVRALNSDERQGIDEATQWFNDLLRDGFGVQTRLTGTREDIPTLHSLLSKGPFTADAEAELVLFGTVFGEVLATEVPMRWVVLTDDDGADFALQYSDLDIFVFPRDMLIKRIERGEAADELNLTLMLDDIIRVVGDQSAGKR